MPRKKKEPFSILTEAAALVSGDRNADYGDAIEDFQCTVDMWNAYLIRRGVIEEAKTPKLEPHDLANMMVLLKMSREAHQHKRDNLVDACGYAECSQQVQEFYES